MKRCMSEVWPIRKSSWWKCLEDVTIGKMEMKTIKMPALITITALLALWIGWGYFSVKNLEKPSYTVAEKNKDYEIRQYDAYIVAEVTVKGNYQQATNEGFTKIADYIFGNNTSSEKIAMTTPVVNSEPENPINERTIAFIMPSKYTLETLPKPNNEEVRLREVPEQRIAVHTFSWWVTEKRLNQKKTLLKDTLEKDRLVFTEIQSARYNPPWTPPFMMRNEIWAILK